MLSLSPTQKTNKRQGCLIPSEEIFDFRSRKDYNHPLQNRADTVNSRTEKLKRTALILYLTILCGILLGPWDLFAKGSDPAEEKIRALNDQIAAASDHGDLPAALQAAQEAVRVAYAAHGEESLKTAEVMSNLASLYMLADRAQDAQPFFQKVVLIELKELEKDDPVLAESYYNLGMAYAAQEKYKAAMDILGKALEIQMKKLGADDPETKKTQAMTEELRGIVYPEKEIL